MERRSEDGRLRWDGAAEVDGGQELLPGLHALAEYAQHLARHHRDARLVHAAGGHALVRRLDDHRDPERLEHAVQARRDLRGHFFLDLKTPRTDTAKPCGLGNPGTAMPRMIAVTGAAA